MRGPNQLKREFLRRWVKGLQIYCHSNKQMSFLERKRAIKLSADVAMASTRTDTTSWGRALIAEASKDDTTKVLLDHVLGRENNTNVISPIKKGNSAVCKNKKIRSKKILRKSWAVNRVRKMEDGKVRATSIAKKMVRKRTQMLKSLVPGGNSMDDVVIIKEALDYIISLRVQVDVMRQMARIAELVNHDHEVVTT